MQILKYKGLGRLSGKSLQSALVNLLPICTIIFISFMILCCTVSYIIPANGKYRNRKLKSNWVASEGKKVLRSRRWEPFA